MVRLRQWWTEKYRSSPKSDEFQAYTLRELLVEYYEDYYLNDRKRLWKDERDEFGDVRLPDVDDVYVDRWEEQWAKGITPDLTEGLPEKERRRARKLLAEKEKEIEEWLKEQEKAKMDAYFSQPDSVSEVYSQLPEEFSDVYGG